MAVSGRCKSRSQGFDERVEGGGSQLKLAKMGFLQTFTVHRLEEQKIHIRTAHARDKKEPTTTNLQ